MKRAAVCVIVTILSFELPPLAEMIGMQVAGTIWNALRLVSPWLSQTGDLIGAIVAGLVVALVLRLRIWKVLAACVAVVVVYLIYMPAALIAAPVAAGLATRKKGAIFAAALTGMGHLLPFPLPVQVALAASAGLAYGFAP
jgi:hypothetical protein